MIGLILMGLAKANLAAGAATLAVLAVRTAVRPRFGAQASYLLWLAPLAAGLAVLAPHPAARTVINPIVLTATAAVDEFVAAAPAALSAGPDWAAIAFGLWVAGVVAALTVLLRRQAVFVAAMGRLEPFAAGGVFRAQSPDVGPAVVGIFRPRIVAPADFETRFGADERELILAHERVHLRRGDAAVNAIACAVQCLCWFNPLVHLAARLLRIDQELACDATVIGRFPTARRTYAELLLKTQLFTQPLPLGCHWPAGAEHPLKARIAMLKSPLPERAMRGLGVVVVAGLTLGAGTLAWAAQPSHLEPADAARLAGPGETVMCRPDAKRELHNCEIKGTPFAVIATPADVAREWPAQAKKAGLTGWVTLNCSTNRATARLEGCSGYHYGGAAERPELKAAFETAALRVISVIRLKANPGPNDAALPKSGFYTIEFNDHPNMPGGAPATNPPATRFPDYLPGPPTPAAAKTAPRPVSRVPVSYAPPASYTPPAGFAEPKTNAQSASAAPFHSIWSKKPTGDDMIRLYPAEALAKDLTGDVTMSCKVGADGRLNGCTTDRATVSGDTGPAPAADPGFGAATLELAKLFQMEPTDRQGAPTVGAVIRIPVRFRIPHPPQPVTPS
jgi:bla regulator protein blaR1